MSDIILSFRGREIRAAEVAFLRQLIADHPDLSRCALSVRVCQAWNWAQPNGQLRDQICRSLMLRLHREGHIELPAPRIKAVNNAIRHRHVRAESTVDTTPIEGPLQALLPLEIRLVRRAEGEDLFAQLLRDHHYLGYSRPVGEHLKYLVLAGSRPMACCIACTHSGRAMWSASHESDGARGERLRAVGQFLDGPRLALGGGQRVGCGQHIAVFVDDLHFRVGRDGLARGGGG